MTTGPDTRKPSLIRRSVEQLKAYEPGEQPSGRQLIKLNTNENPYPPSAAVARVLRDAATGELRLYPDPVCRELRQQLASYHGCAPDQIIVGNGSDEILALCLRAFVERDGVVGYFDPSYSLYPVLSAIEDLRTAPVPLAPDFTWAMPGDYEADLFFLTNPNAPTSMLFPRDTVESFCESFSGLVVLDEAYVDFANEHCLDLALSMDNVIVARSLSKSFSLAGLRLGYAVASEPLITALYKIKDSYNVNALSQALAGAAVEDVQHMRDNVDRVCATRERLTGALAARGFDVAPSAANFVWAKPTAVGASDLFEALRKRHVLVRHFPGAATGRHLRISVGTDDEVDALLVAIDAVAGEAGR